MTETGPGNVDATMTDPVPAVDYNIHGNLRLHNDPVLGAQLRDKQAKAHRATYTDPQTGTLVRARISETKLAQFNDPETGQELRNVLSKAQSALHSDPVLGPLRRAQMADLQRSIWDKRTRTKWRHAMRHPLMAAYRQRLNSLDITKRERNFIRKRLNRIDEINKSGTTLEMRQFLLDVICAKKNKWIVPPFYHPSVSKNGVRYPGDGGPEEGAVQTDYESDSHESESDKPELRLLNSRPETIAKPLAHKEKQKKHKRKPYRRDPKKRKELKARSDFREEQLMATLTDEARELRLRAHDEKRLQRLANDRQSKANASVEEKEFRRQKEEMRNSSRFKVRKLAGSGALTFNRTTNVGTLDLSLFSAALSRQFPVSTEFQRVIDRLGLVRAGCAEESSVVVLDLEFFATLRLTWQIGITTLNSGRVLLNNRVDHGYDPETLLIMPDGNPMDKGRRNFGCGSIRSVYGSDYKKCSDLKTVDEIAAAIKDARITPKTIVIVWHNGVFDLTLLTELLESAGHVGILPSRANCVTMIPNFRAGLPISLKTRKRFTASLPVIFPLLFPESSLVGNSHSAEPDAQMARLVTLLLIELVKPNSKRELGSFPLMTQDLILRGQASRTKLQEWLGHGITVALNPIQSEAERAKAIHVAITEAPEDTDDVEEEEDGNEIASTEAEMALGVKGDKEFLREMTLKYSDAMPLLDDPEGSSIDESDEDSQKDEESECGFDESEDDCEDREDGKEPEESEKGWEENRDRGEDIGQDCQYGRKHEGKEDRKDDADKPAESPAKDSRAANHSRAIIRIKDRNVDITGLAFDADFLAQIPEELHHEAIAAAVPIRRSEIATTGAQEFRYALLDDIRKEALQQERLRAKPKPMNKLMNKAISKPKSLPSRKPKPLPKNQTLIHGFFKKGEIDGSPQKS